jgi:hypothetical protein
VADVFPSLVADIVFLLHDGDVRDPLAATIEDLLFYGCCTCSPTCANLLTAPFGSSGHVMLRLEWDDEDIIWLSLDHSETAVTAIEVLDGRDLGPMSRQPR